MYLGKGITSYLFLMRPAITAWISGTVLNNKRKYFTTFLNQILKIVLKVISLATLLHLKRKIANRAWKRLMEPNSVWISGSGLKRLFSLFKLLLRGTISCSADSITSVVLRNFPFELNGLCLQVKSDHRRINICWWQRTYNISLL